MSNDFVLQLKDYRLTTAEIIYRRPDYRSILQTYVWQELDIAPEFPVLKKFIRFWQENLEGPLVKVRVGAVGIIQSADYRFPVHQITFH